MINPLLHYPIFVVISLFILTEMRAGNKIETMGIKQAMRIKQTMNRMHIDGVNVSKCLILKR